jgi:hypothetical protein
MAKPSNSRPPGRIRQAWQRRKDAPGTLGIAMAAVAVLFVIGIVTAFNNARTESAAKNPPVTTASHNATPSRPQPETTGTGTVNQPALPSPRNEKP